MIIDSESESENRLGDGEKVTYRQPLHRLPFPLPESCEWGPKPSAELEWRREPRDLHHQVQTTIQKPLKKALHPQDDEPDVQPGSVAHEDLDGMANLAPVIQPKANNGNRRSSGRMQRRIQIDSRYECDTEIML